MENTDEKKIPSKNSTRKEIISFLILTVGCILFVRVFTSFVMKPITVDGDSMYPTYQEGDRGFTNILAYNIQDIYRFETVVFHSPLEDSKLWVKRVIGLPGERIRCTDGIIYINDVPLDESVLQLSSDVITSDFDEVLLEEDMYFLMGDNREVSYDSRMKVVGPIHHDKIIGKNVFVFYPFSQFGYKK